MGFTVVYVLRCISSPVLRGNFLCQEWAKILLQFRLNERRVWGSRTTIYAWIELRVLPSSRERLEQNSKRGCLRSIFGRMPDDRSSGNRNPSGGIKEQAPRRSRFILEEKWSCLNRRKPTRSPRSRRRTRLRSPALRRRKTRRTTSLPARKTESGKGRATARLSRSP